MIHVNTVLVIIAAAAVALVSAAWVFIAARDRKLRRAGPPDLAVAMVRNQEHGLTVMLERPKIPVAAYRSQNARPNMPDGVRPRAYKVRKESKRNHRRYQP